MLDGLHGIAERTPSFMAAVGQCLSQLGSWRFAAQHPSSDRARVAEQFTKCVAQTLDLRLPL